MLYTSSYNGYGPVATSLVAKELGLKCIVILGLKAFGKQKNSTREEAEQSSSVKKCRELGATVIFVDKWSELVLQGMKHQEDKSVYWIPLGFKDENNLFEDILVESLSTLNPMQDAIKRLWVVGGSGVLARSLSRALPKTNILLVPVDSQGKSFDKLLLHVSSFKNITTFERKFPPQLTPYRTIKGYDSKAWDGAVICGKDGDYVWNVAS